MEQEYREIRRVMIESQNLLETLESASRNGNLHPAAWEPLLGTFSQNIKQLSDHASSLRTQLNSEPQTRRQVWRARLTSTDEHILELRNGYNRCATRLKTTLRDRAMREELLQRRNPSSSLSSSRETIISGMDVAVESRILDQSSSLVGTILQNGRQTLFSLTQQRDSLHSARRKLLDVLHQSGIDRRIIERIERRGSNDMILVYALMTLLLIFLGIAVFWKYHRRRLSL